MIAKTTAAAPATTECELLDSLGDQVPRSRALRLVQKAVVTPANSRIQGYSRRDEAIRAIAEGLLMLAAGDIGARAKDGGE